ncbi:hypothetical protein GCM10028822_07660 [Hymenobacter terrigena]
MEFAFLLLTALFAGSVPKPPAATKVAVGIKAATAPHELIIVNQQIWYLAANGKITIYNTQGVKQTIPSVQTVTAKHIANAGKDVVAQISNKLQRWSSSDKTWREIGNLEIPVFALAVNSNNQVYAITPKGVLDTNKNTFHLPVSSPNDQIRQLQELSTPATYFMDNQDNLWLGYGYGEWGGNIFTYSTKSHKFVNLKFNDFQINLSPIKSFFQLKNDVGVSSGLQHMMNSGAITIFHNFSAQPIYNSRREIDAGTQESRGINFNQLPYIGPAMYEAGSEEIYFYANKGVFKGKAGSNLSKLGNWQLVFTPNLHWRSGQPDAVGSPMNVLKMLSLGDGKLALLTQDDGVGIWNGTSFKLLP